MRCCTLLCKEGSAELDPSGVFLKSTLFSKGKKKRPPGWNITSVTSSLRHRDRLGHGQQHPPRADASSYLGITSLTLQTGQAAMLRNRPGLLTEAM